MASNMPSTFKRKLKFEFDYANGVSSPHTLLLSVFFRIRRATKDLFSPLHSFSSFTSFIFFHIILALTTLPNHKFWLLLTRTRAAAKNSIRRRRVNEWMCGGPQPLATKGRHRWGWRQQNHDNNKICSTSDEISSPFHFGVLLIRDGLCRNFTA